MGQHQQERRTPCKAILAVKSKKVKSNSCSIRSSKTKRPQLEDNHRNPSKEEEVDLKPNS